MIAEAEVGSCRYEAQQRFPGSDQWITVKTFTGPAGHEEVLEFVHRRRPISVRAAYRVIKIEVLDVLAPLAES